MDSTQGVNAEYFIHDDNAARHDRDLMVNGQWMRRGRVPRDFEEHPLYESPVTAAVDFKPIPRSEWRARLDQMIAEKSRISDILRNQGIKSLNQQQTNYCWANGPTGCIVAMRAINNLPYIPLSPASVAAPVTGYRNVGGIGTDALEYIAKYGVCSADVWPPNAIQRSLDNPTTQANRANHKALKWYDLDPGNNIFDYMVTLLLNRKPVAVGYNWWSHEVMACDLEFDSSGRPAVRIRNSWGDDWSDQGFAVLNESKGTPDDAVSPYVVSFSDQ